jgi:hypothetical protein
MNSLTRSILEQLEVQRDFNIQMKRTHERLAADFDEAAVQCQDVIHRIRRGDQDLGCLASKRAPRNAWHTEDAEVGGRRYIGVREAAKLTGLAPTTIQSWCRKGLPDSATRRHGRRWQMEREAFLKLAADKNFLPSD